MMNLNVALNISTNYDKSLTPLTFFSSEIGGDDIQDSDFVNTQSNSVPLSHRWDYKYNLEGRIQLNN